MIIEKDVPLRGCTTYKIGGPAAYFAEIKNEGDIKAVLDEWRAMGGRMEDIFIMGGGANVLFPESGFKGLVMRIAIADISLSGSDVIDAGSGAQMKDVVEFAAKNGLTGLEWASGLPGYLGGAVRGNAGAFGGEMKDSVIEVRSVLLDHPERAVIRDNSGCEFGYRTSIYKRDGGEIITGAKIGLSSGDEGDIRKKMAEYAAYRNEHQPLEFPSAGSTFKNVDVRLISEDQKAAWKSIIKTDPFPVVPVAFLLSEAGLKGARVGGAMISEKHPNFFINYDNATSDDVKELIGIAKERVRERFDIEIEPEIQIVD